MDDASLWDAYRKTRFEAETPVGKFTIRIDESSADVDELLRRNNTTEWAFITAYNPASQVLSPEENRKRHTELKADLSLRGLTCFLGQGVGADPNWAPEESLLVFDISRNEAVELGHMYGQNAVVWGCLGQPAELVDCRGPH